MTATPNSHATADETDLTAAVHQVLTSLTHVRRGEPLAPERRRDRIELIRWLRRELAEVESLLVAATPEPAPPTAAR